MRPSKRPVPRVQVEVLICRTSDIRNIGRRCRPQPGPVLRFAWFADAREQFDQAAYNRLTANQIEFEIETVKLGRAGNAQPISQPRKHQLVPSSVKLTV